jgi:hypothetical protein
LDPKVADVLTLGFGTRFPLDWGAWAGMANGTLKIAELKMGRMGIHGTDGTDEFWSFEFRFLIWLRNSFDFWH